jgi:NTE family protein
MNLSLMSMTYFFNHLKRCLMPLLVVALLAGCSSLRPWQNLPMKPYDDRELAQRDAAPAQNRKMLMLVSISGGGARAAAFGYGVLDALHQTQVPWQGQRISLIDELDLVSGVSGGSIIAAYYAAFGKDTFPAFDEQFLRKSFQDNLVSYAFKPGSLYGLTSPWFGRSNLLERRFNDLFQGKTFANLTEHPGQPGLLVSATDLSLGSGFEFSWRQFSLICSDLDSVPLSFAVAASSAVPIALSPMTLKNYSDTCAQPMTLASSSTDGYRVRLLRDSQRSYLDAKARPYIHLVDGGLVDNLGLRSLLDRSQANGGLRQTMGNMTEVPIEKLVIIAVNAERAPTENIDTSDQVPGISQVMDALLFGTGGRATQETLELLRDTVQAWRKELHNSSAEGKDPFAPDAKIYVINVNLSDAPELEERRLLLQIPTAFSLPPGDVTRLEAAGGRVLRSSLEFQALLKDLDATTVAP